MDIKKILQPGMLVKLRSGDIVIVTLSNGYQKELLLSWNDGSSSCLSLSDYQEDLVYKNKEYDEYTIDTIYDIGSFQEPFNMEVKSRNIIWSRDGKGFSLFEKSLAHTIKAFIREVTGSPIEKLFIFKNKIGYITITGSPTPIQLTIPPENSFINLEPNTAINLDDIINGEILQ